MNAGWEAADPDDVAAELRRWRVLAGVVDAPLAVLTTVVPLDGPPAGRATRSAGAVAGWRLHREGVLPRRALSTGLADAPARHRPPAPYGAGAAAAVTPAVGPELPDIGLDRVVSRYLRETEEQVGCILDRAGDTGAVVVLDEADDLFHGRAGAPDGGGTTRLEVGYVLDDSGALRGLAVLTTGGDSPPATAFVRASPRPLPPPEG